MTILEERAKEFATDAHRNQRRKYTNEPYINHPAAVAKLVEESGGTKHMIAAAWLHDVVEDTEYEIEDIELRFGPVVRNYVAWLTDVSNPMDGNRAARKAKDREHIAKAPPEVKTIKLADLIDNTKSIVQHDPAFAKVYLEEKRLLLEVLREGDAGLWAIASILTTEGVQP